MTGPSQSTSQPKRVWITGAGKGIGRALALAYAQRGWHVAASARTSADLVSLMEAAKNMSGKIDIFPLDIRERERNHQIFAAIEKMIGPLDLVILNAGTHQPMHAHDFSSDTVARLVDVNLMGTVHGLDAVLPAFRARHRGHVAVVSSVAGYRGLPSSAAYGATKAALINMCEALYPELAAEGVRLSLINPGFVDTPLTRKNDFPMPFLVTAEDAAAAIIHGLHKGKFEIVFPRKFSVFMQILRKLPNALLFAITRRMARTEQQSLVETPAD